MEKYECVKEKLYKLGEDIETLKPYLVKHLLNIEEELSIRRDERKKAIDLFRHNNYDVKSISRATGISRTTFYNYDSLLQRFVELSHEEDYKDDPYTQLQKLRENFHMLQEENKLMKQRDCYELKLRRENERLKQQIVERDKTINTLRKRIMEV